MKRSKLNLLAASLLIEDAKIWILIQQLPIHKEYVTQGVSGLVDEAHAVVVHAVVNWFNWLVHHSLTLSKYLDAVVLELCNFLLTVFYLTLCFLDSLDEDSLIDPTSTLSINISGQWLTPIFKILLIFSTSHSPCVGQNSIFLHVFTECNICWNSIRIMIIKVWHVASCFDCLGRVCLINAIKLRNS